MKLLLVCFMFPGLVLSLADPKLFQKPTKPLAVKRSCRDGKNAILVRFVNTKPQSFVVGATSSDKKCYETCLDNDKCVGAGYTKGECMVWTNLDANMRLEKSFTSFQKQCVNAPTCNSKITFDAVIGYQMQGHGLNTKAIMAKSYQGCLTKCMKAEMELGFVCKSAVYYARDIECILHDVNKQDRPDLYGKSEIDMYNDRNVVYFENTCAGKMPVKAEAPATCEKKA